MDAQSFHYDVFISYRHKPFDTAVAGRVARFLETYRLPKQLAKQGHQGVRRVFRDTEELAVSGVLSDTIATALYSARILLVVCSPSTPQSEWVDREIATFIALGRADYIYVLLIKGDEQSSFPPNLHRVANLRERTLDVRAENQRQVLAKAKEALLDVVAQNAGCSAAALRQAQRLRRMRRTGLRFATGVLLLALVSGVSLSLWAAARQYRAEALADQAATMEMIDALTYTLPMQLGGLPGTTGIVSSLLATNVQQIDTILEASPDPDTVRREKAVNLDKLARVQATLGEPAAAVATSRQAVELYRARYEENESTATVADYSAGLNNLANRLNAQGDFDEAQQALTQAIELQQGILGYSAQTDANLARYYHNRAGSFISAGRLDEAIADETSSVALLQGLGAQAGDVRSDLIASQLTLASAYNQLGQYPQGAEAMQWALTLAEELYDQNANRASLTRLATVYSAAAANAALSGNEATAAEYYEKAIAWREELAYDAENAEAQDALAVAYLNYGASLNTNGHHKAAEEYFLKALDVRSAQAAGASALGQARLAHVYFALAENALDAAQYAESQIYYDDCLALYGTVAQDLGDAHLSEYLSMRAYYALVFSGSPAAALDDSRQAVALMPASSFANYIYGYALMYGEQREACLQVFQMLAERGENEKQTIREDLQTLTAKGLYHPLMEEIQALVS